MGGKSRLLLLFLLPALLALVSCSNENYAPVNNAWYANSGPTDVHVVQKGETLYAVAWRYDMDYRTLAAINHLSPPYTLEIGQRIALKGKMPAARPSIPVQSRPMRPMPVYPSARTIAPQPTQPVYVRPTAIKWYWPAKGRIVSGYSPAAGKKGIDIAGQMGEPVKASASGRVAYSGSGLRGYGNLIIIKHNNEFLSAYAHNQKLLVREGQEVKAGQVIALMGNTESKRVMLHFEIRRAGKSVNPLNYVKP